MADRELEIVVRARDALTAELKRMGLSLQDVERIGKTAFGGIDREVREVQAGLKRTEQGASAFGGAFRAVGASIKSALLPILPILTLAGAAFAATDSIKQAAEFERALAGISAEAGITGPALQILKREALETTRALGLDEAKSAPALLKALTDGADGAAEGLARFDAAARLSQATSGDLARSTDTLNSILNAFREQGLSAAEAADVLFATAVRGGKLDVDELGGSVEAVLPLVRGMGVSFDELAAVIVTASRAGGGLQQGMQAVRGVLGALTGDNEKAAVALRGLDFSSARIKAEGLVPVLRDVAARLGDDAEAIRKVFPDARSFGVIMALLKDDGRALTEELNRMRAAAGGVEAALGRRLRDPAEQLRVLFANLRSEFSQSFGSAFFRGIERAVQEMGGFEIAIKTARDIGKTLGDVFGVVFPAIGSVIGNAATALKNFIDSIGGVEQIEGRMRAVSDAIAGVLGSVLQIARAQVDALIRTILLIPKTLLAARDELDSFSIFGSAKQDLERIDRQLATFKTALQAIKTPDFFGAELPDIFEQARKLPGFPIDLDTAQIKKRIAELEQERVTIQARVDGGNAFERLGQDVDAIGASLAPVEGQIDRLGTSLDSLATAFTRGSVAPVKRTIEDASAAFRNARGDIEFFEFALKGLASAAAAPGADLGDLAAHAVEIQRQLDGSREAAEGFKQELELLVGLDIKRVEGEIRKVEAGLVDARSVAELLGLTGEDALAKIGRGADQTKLEQLTAELDALKNKLDDLRGAGPAIAETIGTATRDLGRSLKLDAALERIFGSSATGPILSQALQLGTDIARRVRVGMLEEAQARRDATLGDLLGLGPAENEVIGQIVAAQIDIARGLFDALEREAAQGIQKAQEQVSKAARDREALSFGISLDSDTLDADIIRAKGEAQAFADGLAGRGVRLEAISLGIGIDGKSTQALREEIEEARFAAQQFAQENPIAAEALSSGIRGLSSAIAQVASGARSAKEAFSDFARSTIQNLIQVAVQAALVRAIIVSFGGAGSPAGAFVASAFGVAGAARGRVIGGDEPGMAVHAYARGGSPYIDRIVDRPTLERASALAGTAIVPLSGGGVETTSGRHLPFGRRGGELAVRRYAEGGLALFGEAGPEALPRIRRTGDGRPGILAADGGIMPLARVRGGRLGVQEYALGDAIGGARPGRVTVQREQGISVQVTVPVSVAPDERGRDIERRARSSEFREAVAAAVRQELEGKPSFRASVRGDRA